MDGVRAPKGHIDDLIQLINEEDGITANRDGGDLASCNRSNEVRLLFRATTIMDHRLLMSCRERFDDPALHDEKIAGSATLWTSTSRC